MPTYEYECKNCQHGFEVQQSIKEESLKTCPSCRKDSLRRLISQTSFVLKGSGWAADNYAKPTNK